MQCILKTSEKSTYETKAARFSSFENLNCKIQNNKILAQFVNRPRTSSILSNDISVEMPVLCGITSRKPERVGQSVIVDKFQYLRTFTFPKNLNISNSMTKYSVVVIFVALAFACQGEAFFYVFVF